MNKATFNDVLKAAKKAAVKHGPAALIGIGVVGFTAAAVFAILGTVKAVKSAEEEPVEIDISEGDKKIVRAAKTVWAYTKRFWKHYLLTVLTLIFSTACILTSNHITMGRMAALSSAYKLTEAAFANYQNTVAEEVGVEKEADIYEKSQETFVIYPTEMVLCKENITHRVFYSCVNNINAAINNINKEMLTEMQQSVNDYCYEMGIPNVSGGDDEGWDINKGFIQAGFKVEFTDDGRPCMMVTVTKTNTDFKEMR